MSLTTDLFGGADPTSYWNNVETVPTASSETYQAQLDRPVSMQAVDQGSNALAGANGSVAGQAAQGRSLANLEGMESGGLNASDLAKLYQSEQDVNAKARARQGAIMQGAAQRGQAGSGASLAAQLAAEQSAQEAGANAGEAVAGGAADRGIQATQAAGQLGGSMNQQALSQQALVGGAQNAINANNARAHNVANQTNAAAANSANQFNVNQNTAQNQFKAGLTQQEYQNQANQAGAKAGETVAEQQLGEQAFGAAAGAVGGAARAAFAHGGEIPSQDFRAGGHVPGKPEVNHDSYKNDTVPAMVSPGELVLDLDTLHAGPDAIIAFIEKHAGIHFEQAHGKKAKGQ